jgi:histidine triad (HIT) family protein
MACKFCEIAAGKEKQRVFAENAHAAALLDYRPIVPGHSLVIPKKHYESIAQIPTAELHAIFALVGDVEKAVMGATGAQGVDLQQHFRPFIPEGELKVNHLHFHILPRKPYDELFEKMEAVTAMRARPKPGELEAMAKKIKTAMDKG